MIKKIIKKLFSNNKRICYSNLIVDIDDDSKEYIKLVSRYALKGELEIWAIISSFRNVLNQKIDGDVVEAGVWKGGTIILLKKILDEFDVKKKIIGFDTFEYGFDKPSEYDKKIKYGVSTEKNLFIKKFNYKNFEAIPIKDSLENIKKNCSNIDDILLVKGKIQETLETQNLNKISFLLLDLDYYESTKFVLDKLYDKVTKNGIIYIDDYGNWGGAKKAVDEFFSRKGIVPFLIRTSSSSRIFIKNFWN